MGAQGRQVQGTSSQPKMSESIDKALDSKKAAQEKAANIGLVNTTTGFGAGAGGGFGLNKPGFGPAVKNFAPESSDGKGNIQVDAEVVDAWKKVLDDDIPLGWVIAVYADDNKSLVLQESDEGGLKEFKERLPEDRIAWGGFRCYRVQAFQIYFRHVGASWRVSAEACQSWATQGRSQ